MQLKLETAVLQDMVGKAVKGASENKLIPITSLMNLSVNEDKEFVITTTDSVNYFYVTMPGTVDCEPFEISVLSERFSRLIQKTTTKSVTLTITDDNLSVKGNGDYHLELPLDENGKVIKFPKKLPTDKPNVDSVIKKNTVEKVLNYNKNSLATSVQLPSLLSYYCGDMIMTSNRISVVKTDRKVFDTPRLIPSQVMSLMETMSGEDISVSTIDNAMLFYTNTEAIYSPIVDGVDTFPVTSLNSLIDTAFNSMCKVSRTEFVDALDRLSLFVTQYDHKGIALTFTKDGVLISSKKSDGKELIPYIGQENQIDFTCEINVELLRLHIGAQVGEAITMYYGSDMAIKMVCEDVTQIVALSEEGDNGEE